MTPFERASLSAAAAAHHATGAPIAVHLERGNGAFEVVGLLRALDVSSNAIVLRYLGRILDAGNVDVLLVGGHMTTRDATTGSGGRGMSGLLTHTYPAITRAFGDVVARALVIANPARTWRQRGRSADLDSLRDAVR